MRPGRLDGVTVAAARNETIDKILFYPTSGVDPALNDLTYLNDSSGDTWMPNYLSMGSPDPWGNTRLGLSATTKINRKDFGLTWNAALETGGILVGDEVTITLDVQFVKA